MTKQELGKFWLSVGPKNLSQSESWPWRGTKNQQGYGRFAVTDKDGVKRYRPAHKVSWEIKHGPFPEGLMACHTCDNPWCVNPSHVYPGTALNNATDAKRNRFWDKVIAKWRRQEEENTAPGLA